MSIATINAAVVIGKSLEMIMVSVPIVWNALWQAVGIFMGLMVPIFFNASALAAKAASRELSFKNYLITNESQPALCE